MSDISGLLYKIASLKASVLKDSISPVLLGSILEEMLGYVDPSTSSGDIPDIVVGVSSLKDLDDVSLSSLSNGQALVFTGSKWENRTISQGLDESSLASYLSSHHYALISDIPDLTGYATLDDIPSLSGYATEQWVLGKKYISQTDLTAALADKLDASVFTDFKQLFDSMFRLEPDGKGGSRIKALFGLYTDEFLSAKGLNDDDDDELFVSALSDLSDVLLSGLAEGDVLVYNGSKWENRTISQGLDEAALGSYLTLHHYALKTDIPSLTGYATQQWVLGKKYISQSDLTAALADKLDASVFTDFKQLFDSMFRLEPDGKGGSRIKALFGLYTDEFLSAKGLNDDDDDELFVSALSDLSDVLLSGLAEGDVLVYNGSKWENRTISQGLDETALDSYLSVHNYALKSDIPSLTEYATRQWVLAKEYASASNLTAHTSDNSIHITSDERSLWNNTASSLASIIGSDADMVLNKWDEIVAFLSTYTEADTLAGLLSNKADKSVLINAGSGLSGGGSLSADVTLALASSGIAAGTYTKLTVDVYGRATAGDTLSVQDIPGLPISKTSGLQLALDNKLNSSIFFEFKQLFDSMFRLEPDGKGGSRIKALFGLYTDEFLSSKGLNDDDDDFAGNIGDVPGLMLSWPSEDPGEDTTDALGANLGWDLNARVAAMEKSAGKTEGGNVLAHRFSEDFEQGVRQALAYAKTNGFSTVDASWYSGTHTCVSRFIIDFPVTLKLGNVTVKMQDSMFFHIKANNVCIIGCNRQTDRTVYDGNATELMLQGISTQCNDGYHIYSRGNKNCQYRNMVLRGIQTSNGRQCNNTQYPINGTGGIFIEKPNPGTVTFGNTTNATIIENLLIDGTKAHGIYLDTPILSMLRDIRISSAGGHGIFISGGTTVTLESVYVASARYAGFCLQGITYCSVINSVAENCGCGWWLRSVNNVSLFSPGVETTYNLGLNPWSNSQPISKRYGVAEDTISAEGQLVRIVDVPDEEWQMGNRTIHARSLFCGYAFVVTGGRNIAIHTPYSISIANEVDPANPKLNLVKNQLCPMLVLGNCRALHINNALFQEQAGSPIPNAIRHEIEISQDATGVDLSFNPYGTILNSYTSLTPVTADQSKTAPVLCLSNTSMVHCGNRFYTDIVYTGNVEIIGTAKIGGQIMTESGIITKGPIVQYDSATLRITYNVNTELRELDYTYDGTEIKIIPKATFALEDVSADTEFTLYVDGVVRKTQSGNAEMSFKLTSPGEHSIVISASWGDKNTQSDPIVFTVKEPENLPIRFVSTTILSVDDASVRLRISYQGSYVVKEAGIAYSSTNQSPTTSQNSRKLDSVDQIVAAADGLTYHYDIDLPRSSASTVRYVRGYVRATETADASSAYAVYDTQVYKVVGSQLTAL